MSCSSVLMSSSIACDKRLSPLAISMIAGSAALFLAFSKWLLAFGIAHTFLLEVPKNAQSATFRARSRIIVPSS